MSQRIDVPGMGLVEFPDGMSDADIGAAIQRSMPKAPASPVAKPAPGYGAVGINSANEAIAAPFDALLNAPTNVLNLGKAAFGSAVTALGRNDLAPDLTPAPDYARRLFEAAGFIKPENAPQTTGQRIMSGAVKGGVGMMMNPSSSLAGTVALGTTGALSGAASQATKEATGSDLAGNLVAAAAPLAITAAAGAARNKVADMAAQESRNAPKDQALKAGLEAGYQVPPSTVQPTATNKLLESIGGKVATQQETSANNVEVTNRLARQAVGLPPEAALTPEAMQQVRRQAFAQGYAPLENAGTISTGRAYRNDLDQIVRQYEGASRSFPDAVRDDVTQMVDALRRRTFDAGDAVKMSATLRDDASKSFATGDSALGKAQRAAADAIENQIERGLGGNQQTAELMQNFRDARQLMAKAHTVEDAIKVGTGNVDANKLAAALQKGEPLSGDLRTAAEFANNFRKAVQTPQTTGSTGVSKSAALASMLFGGGGAAAGHAAGGAGLAGALGAAGTVAPFVVPSAARSLILSPSYQKSLLPNYDPGAMANLLSQAPQLSSGAALAPLLLTGRGQ